MDFVFTLVCCVANGCQTDEGTSEKAMKETTTEATKEDLQEGVYTGVLVIEEMPILDYVQKALDDPSTIEEVEIGDTEACEEIDLNDEDTRMQIEESLAKGNAVKGVEVPFTVTITKNDQGDLVATAKADFATAFPDYGCEEATDEPVDLEHEPGRIKLYSESVEDLVTTKSIFEGVIKKGGELEGTMMISTDSSEYVQYTKTEVMLSGRWSVKK